MKEQIINQIVVPVLVAVIATTIEVARRQWKRFMDNKQTLMDKQKEALEQTMGIEQYNKDVSTVKQMVGAVEQLARGTDWTGIVKHSKVLEKLEGKTGLSAEDIYNIIKATVNEFNKNKPKTVQ